MQRALADRERLRNEAEAYRNDIIPRARGDAVRIKQEAEAYRQEIIARAQGDADRFLSVYNAFKAAQDVTLQRLYLETMEEILKNSNKMIIDKPAEGAERRVALSAAARPARHGTAGRSGSGTAAARDIRRRRIPPTRRPPLRRNEEAAMNRRILADRRRRAGRRPGCSR